jgi:hypothetical protein
MSKVIIPDGKQSLGVSAVVGEVFCDNIKVIGGITAEEQHKIWNSANAAVRPDSKKVKTLKKLQVLVDKRDKIYMESLLKAGAQVKSKRVSVQAIGLLKLDGGRTWHVIK